MCQSIFKDKVNIKESKEIIGEIEKTMKMLETTLNVKGEK
ncbi:hypothetical protein T11_18386 [Trichinella zimbabwensis]|uniref:Uncharacterized protein n=1 Tax=Trichinella zimbabwensis TaxID=268475 RepID=A0A0V1G965_9BILA|nr:hypothetical protein T11_18386 [Trichinella zimbabwensis]